MTIALEWTGRVGASWASEWRRTDRSFGQLTRQLLDFPESSRFDAALDVGCGAGEVSLALARGNPSARVCGLDISPDLLAIARERGRNDRNVDFAEGDASQWWPGEDFRSDLLISRHGVMFFDDPAAAFSHLRGIADPDAVLRFSCFRARAENGWVAALTSVLPQAPEPGDPYAPGPFAFGDRERVMRILASAGWKDMTFQSVDYAMVVGEGSDAVEDALGYFNRIGPAARVLTELAEDQRAETLARLRHLLEAQLDNGKIALPAAGWIVTARAASAPA